MNRRFRRTAFIQ